jgi:hypothetical protein
MHAPPLRSILVLVLAALAATACTRDRSAGPDEVTDAERAGFVAPADSGITVEQVERYLRTAHAHLDLLRREAPTLPPSTEIPSRPSEPGAAEPARPRSMQTRWNGLVDATFVRTARGHGYSPAEMWYVRDRIVEVSGLLLADRMHGSRDAAAALFREQAAAMRGAPGVTEDQIQAMLTAAAQAEEQTSPPASERAVRNAAVLRRARPSLDEGGWARIARASSGAGVAELATADDADRERALVELRDLFEHALEGRPLPPE